MKKRAAIETALAAAAAAEAAGGALALEDGEEGGEPGAKRLKLDGQGGDPTQILAAVVAAKKVAPVAPAPPKPVASQVLGDGCVVDAVCHLGASFLVSFLIVLPGLPLVFSLALSPALLLDAVTAVTAAADVCA